MVKEWKACGCKEVLRSLTGFASHKIILLSAEPDRIVTLRLSFNLEHSADVMRFAKKEGELRNVIVVYYNMFYCILHYSLELV